MFSQLDQGDLGLPSREYYIGSSNSTVLTAYADFMRGAALALGGQENVVDRDVADLIQFETELAKVHVCCLFADSITCLSNLLQ